MPANTFADLTAEDIRGYAEGMFGDHGVNEKMSNGAEVRFGAKGSIVVNLKGTWRGRFKNWETDEKGWVVPEHLRPKRGEKRSQSPDAEEKREQRQADEEEARRQAEEEARRRAEAAAAKKAHILQMWGEAESVVGTPAEAYLLETRRLPIAPHLGQMRYHPRHRLTPDSPAAYPALLVPFRADTEEDIVGIGAVRLTPAGTKVEREPAKPCFHLGQELLDPVYVQLGDPEATTMVVAEGVETGLSRLAAATCDLRVCWGSLKYFEPPPHIRRVDIVADADKVQEARKLARQYAAQDLPAFVIVPPRDTGARGDLNDVLLNARDADEGMERLGMVLSEAERIEAAKGSKATRNLRLNHGSDVEIAQVILERLEDLYGPIVTADASPWYFANTHFAALQGSVLVRHIHSADGAFYLTPEGKPSIVKLSKSRVNSIADSMLSYRNQPDYFVEQSASAPPVIPASNGVLVFDQRTGEFELQEHSRRHRNRHVLPGRYLSEHVDLLAEIEAGSAKAAAAFSRTLLGRLLMGCFYDGNADDATRADADQKVALVQEITGVVASGWATRMRSPRAIVAFGEKAGNGKSQYTQMLQGLVPKANRCSVSPADFSNEYYSFLLIGALLNAVDELPERAIQSDRFKAIITGDAVPARQIYREAGTVRPQALHWLTTNQLPKFRDGVDAGVLRRLLFLQFDRVIPEAERIPWIGARIAEEEADLLLAFAAQGLSRFLENQDYTIPSSSGLVMQQFAEEADSVRGWLAARTEYAADADVRTFASEAYDDYREWTAGQGIQSQYIVTANTFGKRISRALPELPPENRRKSNGKMYYPGLRLLPSTGAAEDFG